MNKKIAIIAGLSIGVLAIAGAVYYFSTQTARIGEIYQEAPYSSPSLPPGDDYCGGIIVCNGTRSYTCNGPAGVEMRADFGCSPPANYTSGPCCITCGEDECLERASFGGSCTGSGGCTISNLDCYCNIQTRICEPTN